MGSQGPLAPLEASASMRLPFPATGNEPASSAAQKRSTGLRNQGVVTSDQKTLNCAAQQLERNPSDLRSEIFIEIAGDFVEKLSYEAL